MKHDPRMKICYDRIIPVRYNSSEVIINKMHYSLVLKHSGIFIPREAFHGLDPKKVIPAPHLALMALKTWPVGTTLKCRFLD